MREHGTRTKYVHDGCRCLPCRAANADYASANNRARQQGRVGLVDAGPSRNHVRNLMEAGMGWKRVAELAGVSSGSLAKLLGYGEHSPSARVREETARKLQAVRADLAPGATVKADATWQRIDELLAVGYSRAAIGRYLTGSPQTQSLQVSRDRVTVATATKIERLHRAVMAHREGAA